MKPPRDFKKFTAKWYGHVHDTKKIKDILDNGKQDKKESNTGMALDKLGKRVSKPYLEEMQRERTEGKILVADQKI
jgi:hypothetical protein